MSALVEATDALVAALKPRPGLALVNVDYAAPDKGADLRTADGRYEGIWFEDADSDIDVTTFGGGDLRFDESLDLQCVVQVLGSTSAHTQRHVDQRCNELVLEVIRTCSEDATLGAYENDSPLADFDLFEVTPISQSWTKGKLEGSEAFGSRCLLTLQVKSRRSITGG